MFIVYTLSKDARDGLSRASTLSKQSGYKIVPSKQKDLLGNLYWTICKVTPEVL